jgi:hypothetical protein
MFFRILQTVSLALIFGFAACPSFGQDWTPKPVATDHLVRMPGTQPAQGVSLESPNRCLNCHAGYDAAVEPGGNWKGSMMSQAARDFLFWSCLAVAAQDSIWALGNPNATDICLRCHFPAGWLDGRSDPTNASAMTGADFDGVHCDFCHSAYDPLFAATHNGTREGSDWLNYWDETNASGTPSQSAANATRSADWTVAAALKLFNGADFYTEATPGLPLPFSPDYTENASGQYFVSGSGHKRAPFADASARHTMYYSRYHKSRYFCSTCHDVSNPILANLNDSTTQPLTTEKKAAHSFYHVERTFSEFMLSAYGQQGGAAGTGPYAPTVFTTSQPGNFIASCQDCHMRDVSGKGCDKADGIDRPAGSTEHPKSGQPLHDMTGGNVFVSNVLASAVTGSPNFDATNRALLNQGPAILTLDLGAGQGIDPVKLLAGATRAQQQLQRAASILNLDYYHVTGELTFRVQNQTGHRLISGFPEGRRMFVNVKAYDEAGNLLYEVNPFDAAAGTLKGLSYSYSDIDTFTPLLPAPQAINPATARHVPELVYEMHPSSSLTGEEKTFHFALSDGRRKDNRIPPKGFDIANAASRISMPVWDGVSAPGYFTPAEYAGGHDDVALTIAPGATTVTVSLMYQTTSREYMEFLRNEINGTGTLTLASPSPHGLAAYRAQTDPFFSQLKAWGPTIWRLWKHNYQQGIAGAVPIKMTEAVFSAPVPVMVTRFMVE